MRLYPDQRAARRSCRPRRSGPLGRRLAESFVDTFKCELSSCARRGRRSVEFEHNALACTASSATSRPPPARRTSAAPAGSPSARPYGLRCTRSRRPNRCVDHRWIQLTRSPWNPVRLSLGSTDIPLAEMAKLDYFYMTNWSLWGTFSAVHRDACARGLMRLEHPRYPPRQSARVRLQRPKVRQLSFDHPSNRKGAKVSRGFRRYRRWARQQARPGFEGEGASGCPTTARRLTTTVGVAADNASST